MVKRTGPLQEPGRWTDGDKVRFVKGKPQKIGGWIKYAEAKLAGVPRGAHTWNTLQSRTTVAVGTTTKLYALSPGAPPVNVTPFQEVVALTSSFSTTSGLRDIIVHDPAHAKVVGQTVRLSALSGPIAGLNLAGDWIITSIVNSGAYTITSGTPANATTTTSGSVTASYEIPPFTQNPAQGFGFGVGGYGLSTYGSARDESSILFDAGYWSLSNFGQLLLAAPYEGALYEWDPTQTPVPRATRVANSPGGMRGFFVTPERFIVCFGASPNNLANVDPMLLRWCSQDDRTNWTPSVTSSSNTRRLTEGKKLVGGGAMGGGLSLVWSDTALYTMQFNGSREVYATAIAGQNCGLAGPTAFAFTRSGAYWFGSNAFQQYTGSVARIPNCDDVSEWVVAQIRPYFETKTLCFYNEQFNEVWWLFVPAGEDEPSFYAAVNLEDYSWTKGTLRRTSVTKFDSSQSKPLMTSEDGYLWAHETGTDGDGAAIKAFIQSGEIQLQEGDILTQVLGFIPDVGTQIGNLTLTVTARDRGPTDIIDEAEEIIAPGTGLVDIRVRGRLLDFRLTSNVGGGTFDLGRPAFEIMADGRRR